MADLERRAIIFPVTIDTRLKQVPETRPCICNTPAQRSLLPFERSFTSSGRPVIARCEVPGYRCGRDGLEFYDPGAIVEVLSATLDIIRSAGDTTAAGQVAASLNIGRRQLNEINPTPGM